MANILSNDWFISIVSGLISRFIFTVLSALFTSRNQDATGGTALATSNIAYNFGALLFINLLYVGIFLYLRIDEAGALSQAGENIYNLIFVAVFGDDYAIVMFVGTMIFMNMIVIQRLARRSR